MTSPQTTDHVRSLLSQLGVPEARWNSGARAVSSPVDGNTVAHVADASPDDAANAAAQAEAQAS